MKNHRKIFYFLLACLLLAVAAYSLAKKIREELLLKEKISQMIMIGFRGARPSDPGVKSVLDQIKRGQIGGILLLGPNITGRQQLETLLINFQTSHKSGYPLLIALDQEGGTVGRLSSQNGFRDYPSAKQIAATLAPEEAGGVFSDVARLLKELGVNLNLAPVVDLEINEQLGVISGKERSFSKDPAAVTLYAEKFIDAHREYGILTAAKHFPGHGSAGTDTHFEVTDVTGRWQEVEIEPYRALIQKSKLDMVMSAHIFNRNIDERLPASLSAKYIQELLREKIGFRGVVITDDLQMGAIRKVFTLEDVLLYAVNSGSDILLFANYFEEDRMIPQKARKILLRAVREGKIPKGRIDESFERIRRLKSRLSRASYDQTP
jgi:beta-N-acetylhexosaminidase